MGGKKATKAPAPPAAHQPAAEAAGAAKRPLQTDGQDEPDQKKKREIEERMQLLEKRRAEAQLAKRKLQEEETRIALEKKRKNPFEAQISELVPRGSALRTWAEKLLQASEVRL